MGRTKCEHARQRSKCKDCGGSGICEHATGGGGGRSGCKDCGGGGPVTFLEATEVEEFDGEEDPDEWVPTVQARVVGGPRGGKRKRQRTVTLYDPPVAGINVKGTHQLRIYMQASPDRGRAIGYRRTATGEQQQEKHIALINIGDGFCDFRISIS